MKKFCFLVSFTLFCMIGMLSCVAACESLKEDAPLPLVLHPLTLNGSFSGIVNNTVIDVEYKQSPEVVAELCCPAEYREYVVVSVVEGELRLSLKEGLDNSTQNKVSRMLRDSKLFITAPELAKIKVNGSSAFTVMTDLRADNLDVILNGSGDIYFNGVQCAGNASHLKVQVNGSGDVVFQREVKVGSVDMQVNGSGDIDFAIITSRTVGAQVNGSGDIEADELISVSSELSVNGSGDMSMKKVLLSQASVSVNGSGDVVLQGECEKVDYSLINSGDISAKNLVAQDVSALVSGSGDIVCNAQRALTVRVVGSGSVHYRGNPQITYQSKSDNVYQIK